MSKLLDVKLTYHEFCDILTSAMLKAEEITDFTPKREYEKAMFQELENDVKARFEIS